MNASTAQRLLRTPRVLRVVHNLQWESQARQSAGTRHLPRELHSLVLTAYERDYLNWYHGDPLKRSLVQAQKRSVNNRTELLASERCACFHCGARFRPQAIRVWLKDSRDHTALCPECDTDAVLGDASGYVLGDDFLRRMRMRWFGEE